MLLSLPPEWHVTVDDLATFNPDSRGALRNAMRELRDLGYVVLVTERGPDGRTRRHLEVYDTDETKRHLSAVGPTSGNTVKPQVTPNARKPAVGVAAFIRKDGKTRGGGVQTPRPPRVADRCGRCGSDTHQRDECTA